MDRDTLKARTQAQQQERQAAYEVRMDGADITVDGLALTLTENFKEAFSAEKLAMRYTPILAQYDFLVGDISAEQLRIKGFYHNDAAVKAEDKIRAVQDYLYEYVNFGAPYFIIENHTPRPMPEEKVSAVKNNKRPSRQQKTQKKTAAVAQKQRSVATKDTSVKGKATTNGKRGRKRQFTVRQRED